ncbi:Remorin_N domain-containing protein [Psidium guajava]|nr:Remorin_N domain-containing protein [Psidium guajava]
MRKKITVPPTEEKSSESTALVAGPKAPGTAWNKGSGGSIDRDLALAEAEKEKKLTFIKAWEESEKAKADNK